MSGICFDCIKQNKDESLNLIRQEAKQKAVTDGKAMAIYKEGSDYFYTGASEAIAGGFPVIEFISQYN